MLLGGLVVARQGYWQQDDVLKRHRENRKEKYATDPEYALAEKARQRKLYREKAGVDFQNPARDALEYFDSDLDYTAAELSQIVGRAKEYVNRLIGRGLWPDPRPEGNHSLQPCFKGPVAKRLVSAFADHIDNVSHHYRADHRATTKALFAAMNEEG